MKFATIENMTEFPFCMLIYTCMYKKLRVNSEEFCVVSQNLRVYSCILSRNTLQ